MSDPVEDLLAAPDAPSASPHRKRPWLKVLEEGVEDQGLRPWKSGQWDLQDWTTVNGMARGDIMANRLKKMTKYK